MEKKRLCRGRDALFLAGALLLALAVFLWQRALPQGTTAVVERDGETLLRQDLAALSAPWEVELPGADGHRVTVMLAPEGAWVARADCPDQVCVRTGKVTRAGESAVCLPARITLRLEGPGDAADAVTY